MSQNASYSGTKPSLSARQVQGQSGQQAQTVTFNAQMQQAVALLELSNLDLQTYVTHQLLENPFLEKDGDSDPKTDATNENEAPDQSDSSPQDSDSQETDSLYQEMNSEDYDNVWTSDRRTSTSTASGSDFSKEGSAFETLASKEITLRNHLLSQINTDFDSETERLIASTLLDHLDETGYFTASLHQIADQLGASLNDLRSVLSKLKACDPPGVFAESLKECMALQLKDLGELTPKMQAVLDYIDLFAEAKIQELLQKSGCTPQELKESIEKLKRLDPKPGLKFNHHDTEVLIPDVYMTRRSQKDPWIVQLNNETLPRVLVTQDYKIRANLNLKKDKELRQYYQERMNEANWLVRALDQRAQNILKVVEDIIKQQAAFFEEGVSALRPMTLKQVADAIGVHESTVSRITQNKYLCCPRGTFELRYFFSASITNAWTGEDQSALQIQHKIQEIIKNENPAKPLSDDAIVLKLSDYNLDIARRTISKYRELLKIPSSYERKKRHKRSL